MFHYRAKVRKQWREFDLRPISEVPEAILRQATTESLMWDLLGWGLTDPHALLTLDSAPMSLVKVIYREWQRDSQILTDEIMQLLVLADQYSGALEADLINKGMRLRDFPSERHTWRDLWVFVTYGGVHTHTFAATNPEKAGWGRIEQLIAGISDNVSWMQWAKTEAAQHGSEPPDLIVRPGVKAREVRPGSRVKPAPLSRIRERAKMKAPQESSPKGDPARQRQLEGLFR